MFEIALIAVCLGIIAWWGYRHAKAQSKLPSGAEILTDEVAIEGRTAWILNGTTYEPHPITSMEAVDGNEPVTSTSLGSMAGRAVLGGVVLGPLGAAVGAATAKRVTKREFALWINVEGRSPMKLPLRNEVQFRKWKARG